jgi:hypothetical protein
VLSAQSAKQQLKINRGTVFSLRWLPRCYKQDNWSNELVVGQPPVGKNVSMAAEDIFGFHHQATADEETAD